MADVPAYRLRAFEAGFIGPRLDKLRERPQLDRLAYEWTHRGRIDSAMSQLLVELRIIYEAREWVEVGRAIGYFSTSIPSLPIEILGKDIRDFFENDLLLSNRALAYDPLAFRTSEIDPAAFETNLQRAVEDLTDDRIEYLRLLNFASDAEWNAAVAELRVLAEALEAELDLAKSFPPRRATSLSGISGISGISEKADRVSWAFNGPESQIKGATGPAGWRAAHPHASERETDRLSSFARVKLRLRSIARDLAAAEAREANVSTVLASLTRREREILMLAVQGLATRQISEQLFLSTRTVEVYLSRIFEKFGVRSRGELELSLASIYPFS